MVVGHPLLEADVKSAIEGAASRHLGRRWVSHAFTDLNERASHPCGVLHGEPFSVFAKLDIGDNAAEKFQAELSGLTLLRDRARIAIPTPIGTGLLQLDHGSLLLTEALSERPPKYRTPDDWRSIGHTLATLHQVHGGWFGLENFNGFFGPLPQDNKPVTSNHWVDFYSERRVVPLLRSAVDSGHLPKGLARYVERLVSRLPSLCGPEPQPALLHGDAQQHNFVSTDDGAVAADAAPYFGHPEIDLTLVDYLQPASQLRPPSLIATRWTALPAQLATTSKPLYRQARQRSRRGRSHADNARCWALGPRGIKIKYDERGWAPAPASHHALSHISHFAHYFDIFLLTRVSRREMS